MNGLMPLVAGEVRALHRARLRRIGALVLCLGAAAIYPQLIAAYEKAGARLGQTDGAALLATGLMVAAFCVPLLALAALIRESERAPIFSCADRLALHLAAAAPPLFVLSLLLFGRFEWSAHHGLAWVGLWLAVLTGCICVTDSAPATAPGARLRIVHGGLAVTVLVGFLLYHIGNHLLALWSPDLHRALLDFGRQWYRSAGLEPILLTAFAGLLASGVLMAWRYAARPGGGYRTLQTVSGTYLLFFMLAHLLAVLGARQGGIETDWQFAVGANGLLDGRGLLTPYYVLALAAIISHLACGARIVLLAHGASTDAARHVFRSIMLFGTLVTLLISLAMFGVHIAGRD
jgi:succinate dehydrogenase/fumarate reductase cytochrome b subunit